MKKLFCTLLALTTLSVSVACFSDSQASNWMARTAGGQQLTLYEEVDAGKSVVMVFWASWCRFCAELLPAIDSFEDEHQNDKSVRVITFNIWEDSDPAAYLKDNGLKLDFVPNAETIATQYGVKGTPSVFVVNKAKNITYKRKRGESVSSVIASIKTAIK